MYLTEQERVDGLQELFVESLLSIADEIYDMEGDYMMSEEDDLVTSIVMDYFVEHYKQPTMRDAVTESFTGYNINQELFEEILEVMLDESIGTFVAGAAHGLNTVFKARQSKSAAKSSGKAQGEFSNLWQKQNKAHNKAKDSTGIKNTYHKMVAAGLKKRKDAAYDKSDAAVEKAEKAAGAHELAKTKQSNLAHKIDTGIHDFKHKVAGIAGSIVGRFA